MPALTLDFLWGGVAEATFAAMATLPGAASEYVEIGGIAGAEARVPSALLRSRPFRLSGSGIGSFDPRRVTDRSWMTRSSFACRSSGMEPISSSSTVPPRECSNLP